MKTISGGFKLPVMLLLHSAFAGMPRTAVFDSSPRQYGFESQVVGFLVSAFLACLEAVVASDRVVRVLGNYRDRWERGRRMQKCSWMCGTNLVDISQKKTSG